VRKVPILVIFQAPLGKHRTTRVLPLVNIVIHKVTHSFRVQLGMLQVRYFGSQQGCIFSTIEISPIDKPMGVRSVSGGICLKNRRRLESPCWRGFFGLYPGLSTKWPTRNRGKFFLKKCRLGRHVALPDQQQVVGRQCVALGQFQPRFVGLSLHVLALAYAPSGVLGPQTLVKRQIAG
jgi:hypothetical protein